MKILLVEDDEDLGEIVKYNLKKEGFEVDLVYDGFSALERLKAGVYDLLILDIMLPGVDGVELCRIVRKDEKTKNVPVIMLTALSDESTKIKSFDCGADDYVTKPFSIRELIARIRAVTRRVGKDACKIIECSGIVLDRATKSLKVNGVPVHLTKTEYRLMEFFLENQDHAFSREEVIKSIWGTFYSESSRSLDVYISRLRKKLGGKGKFLKTLPKFGYMFSIK